MAFKEPRAFVDRKFQIRRSLLFVVVMVYALACCDRSCSLGIKESCHFSYSTTRIVMLMFVALHLHIGLFKPSLKSLYDVLCFYTSTVWIHV
jgi:hypothetical protein